MQASFFNSGPLSAGRCLTPLKRFSAMFQLRFFGGFARQRREFLAAEAPALPVFHPAVEKQLEGLTADLHSKPVPIGSRRALFLHALQAVMPLVLASIRWNTVSALTVLIGILASREVLRISAAPLAALGLCTIYLTARIVQAAIEAIDVYRRAQINRGIQIALFRIVNRKIAVLDASNLFTTGQLKTLIVSDVEAVEDFLSAAIMQWVPTIVIIAVMGTALLWLAGPLGLLGLFLALLALPLAVGGGRMIEFFQLRAQTKQDRLTTIVGEWVKNIRLVRYLGWQQAIESEVADQMRAYCRQFAFRHTVACIIYGIAWSWWVVPVLGMFKAAGMIGRPLSLEELFATIWILGHLMHYVQMLPYSLSLYGSAAAGADRILELLQAPEITRGLISPKVLESPQRPTGRAVRVHLSDVTVDYGSRKALSNITLDLDLRQRTAVVGSVGSGKSTLLEILIGEKIPSSGAIEVEFENGMRGSLWRTDIYQEFRAQLAYSPQQPFLSNALLRLNIDLTGSRALQDLHRAADKAQLAPDLALLPLGLGQEVGETGINLSGGQKQRVSLARAFISKRPLFILDDPLSAVDTATEGALMNELLSSSAGMILVSHRLDELSRCDRVLVLNEGRVVEDGSPVMLAADPESRFSAFLQALEAHG